MPLEKRPISDPVRAEIRKNIADAFVPLAVRERFTALLRSGMPLPVVGTIDCEGAPLPVALNVEDAVLQFYEDYDLALRFSTAIKTGKKIEFPQRPPSSPDIGPARLQRKVQFANLLFPHFLCSQRERVSFLRLNIDQIPESFLGNTKLSGSPRMAALSAISNANSYGFLPELEEKLTELSAQQGKGETA